MKKVGYYDYLFYPSFHKTNMVEKCDFTQQILFSISENQI